MEMYAISNLSNLHYTKLPETPLRTDVLSTKFPPFAQKIKPFAALA